MGLQGGGGKQWPGLVRGKELEVVYPCVDVRERNDEGREEEGDESWCGGIRIFC